MFIISKDNKQIVNLNMVGLIKIVDSGSWSVPSIEFIFPDGKCKSWEYETCVDRDEMVKKIMEKLK